jgi:serine/threonine-protein phosphatase 2B catalytic subunit
MVEKFF